MFIFLFSIFSGAIRKWIVDSNVVSNIILMVQLLIPFSFLFLLTGRVKSPFSSGVMCLYVIVLLVLAFNPMNLTIFHSAFGVVTHLGFWIAIFFYLENKDLFKLDRQLWLVAIVCVLELLLGLIQYSLPFSHPLNRYANTETIKQIAIIKNSVRVSGTFSYLGGFMSFLLFYALLVWTLVHKGSNITLCIGLYLLGFMGCLMSGSRAPTYIYIIIGLMMTYYEFGSKGIWRVLLLLSIVLLLGTSVFYFLGDKLEFLSSVAEKSYSNFQERRTQNISSGEESNRIMGPIQDVIFFPGEYPLLGVGLGATYQGVTAIWGTSPYVKSYPSWLEEEPERIIVEGGFVLLLLKIVLFIFLYKRLNIPSFAKVIIFVLVFLYVPLVYNIYYSIFFFLGLIFLDSNFRKKNV